MNTGSSLVAILVLLMSCAYSYTTADAQGSAANSANSASSKVNFPESQQRENPSLSAELQRQQQQRKLLEDNSEINVNSRAPAPRFIGKKLAPRFLGKKTSEDLSMNERGAPRFFGKKRMAPRFLGKKNSLGKRLYTDQNIHLDTRGAPLFLGKRPSWDLAKSINMETRGAPRFFGKRISNEDDRLVSLRSSPRFVGKKGFIGNNMSLGPVSSHAPLFFGKRYFHRYPAKRSIFISKEDFIKQFRRTDPFFMGKRSVDNEDEVEDDEDFDM